MTTQQAVRGPAGLDRHRPFVLCRPSAVVITLIWFYARVALKVMLINEPKEVELDKPNF